ncbi:MAG TPA: OmpA family protein, partial [Cyclobacteriaceae bacterium]|nr:OmpA family protein [Cyclobacteriaceae bacterium]
DSLDLGSRTDVRTNEVYILKHIHFQFDSYQLLPSSFAELDFLISILKQHPQWKVQLSGHTDDQGSDDYNLMLSSNRAKSVGDYLSQHGIRTELIETLGFGKQRPLLSGNGEQARSLNRRVEVKFSDH